MIAHGGKRRKRDGSGFTLIELLIVIVVIAILAVITILVYRGITQTTRNTSMSAGVKQYATAARGYYQVHGSYPKPLVLDHSQDVSCLGSGYSGNSCFVVTVSGTPVAFPSQQWLLDALHEISSKLPPLPNDISVDVGGNNWLGGAYYVWTGNTDSGLNNSEYDAYGIPRADALIRFLLLGIHGTVSQQGGCGIPDAYVVAQGMEGVSTSIDITICQLNFEDGNPSTPY